MPTKVCALYPEESLDSLAAGQRAKQYFDQGCTCAQAVLLAVVETDNPDLLEIAKSFGGGIAGAKCLCGAVSGGVMALSLRGKGKWSRELVEEFKRRHRMTCCSALSRPYQWKSPEHRDSCRMLTNSAAEIVVDILQGRLPSD